MLNIVFMGTPDFAKESLKELYNEKHNILGVVTKPDRPKGRGMKFMQSPVKQYAIEQGLDVYQPEKIKGNEQFINKMKELKPDVICVVAYGKILPKEILDIPKLGCINLHGSLLPKYRGAAPIQWSIINGDSETGVTTMYMDIGMDTGDMILKRKMIIDKDETTGELWDRMSKIGAQLLAETLKKIEEGEAPRIKQGKDFSYAPMIDKSIAKIDWTKMSVKEIKNLVRGLNPIMGAYSILNGKKIKFWKVEIINNVNDKYINNKYIEEAQVGSIIYIDDKIGLYVKAKDGIIKLIEVQAENSKKMNICEWIRGSRVKVGEKFM